MLEHRWEKPAKKAREHAEESDVSRVSSLRPAPRSLSPPAPSLQTAPARRPPGSLTESPRPSLRCRSRAARGAAVSGFSRLPTSLCTLLASAEKCPPGRWPPRDPTAQEEGFHRALEGASQTQRGRQLCCQNMAPGQWVWEQSLYSPR